MMPTHPDLRTRLVALVNKVDDTDRLVEFLDPRRKNRFIRAAVEMMLASRQTRPKNRFTDAVQIQKLFAEEKYFEWFTEGLQYAPCTTHPVLLLPLRLETRFKDGHLLVRIYPDQVFVHSHEKSLTQVELTAAETYKKSQGSERRDARRLLSSQFGPRRAAWIRRCVEDPDFDPGNLPERLSSNMQLPHLVALPDLFWVLAYRKEALVHLEPSNPVRADSSIIGSFDIAEEGLFDKRSRWMHDFETALKDGFAVKIKLFEEDTTKGFDRVVAVGLKWTNPSQGAGILEDLLDAHHYSSGLGFVAPGAPTNNTSEVKSPYSSLEDHDAAYEIEVEGPADWEEESKDQRGTYAHLLADALGIDAEILRHIEGAGTAEDSFARVMNMITWLVTGDYYLRYLLPHTLSDYHMTNIWRHVGAYVRGCGPLPTVRIGRQPYGILPVTRVLPATEEIPEGWEPWAFDGGSHVSVDFDGALHRVVTNFFKKWRTYASDHWRVPRVKDKNNDNDTDPDKTLLRILSMEPNSVTYRARPFVDERFIAWLLAVLRDYAFGEGTPYEDTDLTPLEWMANWAKTWEDVQVRIADLLARLTGKDSAEFLYNTKINANTDIDTDTPIDPKPLLKILAWWEGAEEPWAMVRDHGDPETSPHAYLTEICENSTTGTQTLLADIACRALSLAREQSTDEYDLEKEVKEAICWLSKSDLKGQPDLDRLFRESLDLASHRVDAWVTSFATKRLTGIRAKSSTKDGIHLGAYGFVENLKPREDKLSKGYLHTPSSAHAAAAAVLYNAFLTHDPDATSEGPDENRTANPFHINLTSERVRHALRILEGIRQGQPLGALLGYQFERALKDHAEPLEQYIHDFRSMFPIVAHKVTTREEGESVEAEAVAARNVVDGVALIRKFNQVEGKVEDFLNDADSDHIDDLEKVIKTTADTLDAVSDILLTESVYQAVRNYERSGATLEAASGNLPPPELESVSTPVSGRTFNHRLCILFNKELELADADPRGAAEPRIAAWFDSVLGKMEDIGVEFDFWEKETDPDVLKRVNVNTASCEELKSLPGSSDALAQKIIEERSSENGPFKQISDMGRINGIGDAEVDELRPSLTTGYVERVRINVNTASPEDLKALPPIDGELATKIIDARNEKPFRCVKALTRISEVADAKFQEIRALVTTDSDMLRLDELGLSAADFLYIAQVSAEGAETELEQRISRMVRDVFSLPATQRIKIHADRKGDFEHSLENAVELAKQVLKLLAAGRPMSPDTLSHPGDIKVEGYTGADAAELEERVEAVRKWLSNNDPDAPGLIEQFEAIATHSTVGLRLKGTEGTLIETGNVVKHNPTGITWKIGNDVTIGVGGTVDVTATTETGGPPIAIPGTSDWSIETAVNGWNFVQSMGDSAMNLPSNVADLLEKAAQFGIPGAFPPALDDPHLVARYDNTLDELYRRRDACERLATEANGTEDPNVRIRKLLECMKAIFGKSFVALPTFEPHQPKELDEAFAQNVLNTQGDRVLGEERLRLWLQQTGEVSESVAVLEDTQMLIEAWSQASLRGEESSQEEDPSLKMRVAQLPYTEGRHWLGLSVKEGAESKPKQGWTLSPLSIVVASHRDLPTFANPSGDRVVTAGLLLDSWNELIPSKRVNTSVAYQYDAPNTQAPQALLLAVPSQVKEEGEIWTPEALAAIVNDTIDLAKVRAVDIDALAADPNKPAGVQPEPVGGIVPGIYLPTSADQPKWAHETLSEIIERLGEALVSDVSPCADLDGFIAGDGLGPKFESLGMVLESLGGEAPLAHGAGDSITFDPEGIRLSWKPGAKGELRIDTHSLDGLSSMAPPLPEIKAFDADGNEVASGWTPHGGGSYRSRFIVDLDRAVRVTIVGGADRYGQCRHPLCSICVLEPPLEPSTITEGADMGEFTIRSITLQGAPSGDYTFRQDDPVVCRVRLLRNGSDVMELSYDWQTTISFDEPYRFSFSGYFDIDIGKKGVGTWSLYGLKYSVFDGQHVLHVD